MSTVNEETTASASGQKLAQTPAPSLPTLGQKIELTRKFEIRCHDRYFRDATVTDETGEKVFGIEAGNPLTSWSFKRSLKDSSGNLIWKQQHYQSKMRQWKIENREGAVMCFVKDENAANKTTSIVARVPNGTEERIVNLRAPDRSGIKTNFDAEGVVFAEMSLVENNDASFLGQKGLDRTVWKLEVAGEVDIALVLALAFCRIEVNHAWRR